MVYLLAYWQKLSADDRLILNAVVKQQNEMIWMITVAIWYIKNSNINILTWPRPKCFVVKPTTNCFNCYYSFFRVHDNNCWIDLYNRDLQTTIILFIHNVSSRKTDWFLSELPLLALSWFLAWYAVW